MESEKVGLKFNIHKTKIMESDPITSWQRNGETMETVTGCIFLGSKITEGTTTREQPLIIATRENPMQQ